MSSPRPPSTNIWLDGRNVGRDKGTGVYHYAINLHSALKKIGFPSYWLLENTHHTKPRPGVFRLLQALCKYRPSFTYYSDTPWGSAYLARDLYRIAHVHYRYSKRILEINAPYPPHIMHWTYPLPIYLKNCHNIVTLHDLIPLTHPYLTGINPKRFQRLISDLIKYDTHFVTVSETIRQQMLSLFPISPKKVTTLYQPVDFKLQERESIKNAPQIAPKNCFIIYGRVEHRKNIERLLHAHALSQTQTPLVIIGPDGDDQPDCTPRSRSSHVIRLPWSERLSLLRTLSEAKALLFPSLAEGFGLPIIEAMALGVPVLTSKGGVTEEIAGGAALLCDPNSTQDLAKAINHLDNLSSTERESIIHIGKERAFTFSEKNCLKNIQSFYESFSGKNTPFSDPL